MTCATRGSRGAGQLLHLAQQRHLGRAVQRGDRVHVRCRATAARRYLFCTARTPGAACSRNRPHSSRRVEQRSLGNVVGVGKRGFLAADGAHAHALVDAEGAGLDDALFQAPAFVAGVLEVQVGVVHLVGRDFRQRTAQVGLVEAKGREQQALGNSQAFKGGFAGDHGPILGRTH
jgi:hypothetical protein